MTRWNGGFTDNWLFVEFCKGSKLIHVMEVLRDYRILMVVIIPVLAMSVLVYCVIRLAFYLELKDPLEQADVILVFSGDRMFWRTIEAVNLYKKGIAKYLIFTGCSKAIGVNNQDNPFVLERKAIAMGVPSKAIFLVADSFDTYGEVVRSKEIIAKHHFKKIIFITSPYHQRRAYLLGIKQFRDLGIKLLNHPAFDPPWNPDNWWQRSDIRRFVFSEFKKLLGSWLLGWIGPLPNLSNHMKSCGSYMQLSYSG